MKEKAFRELHMELCWNIVKGGKKMDYINAFWVGGLICALAQILLDRTKMMPGRVMVSLAAFLVLYRYLNHCRSMRGQA